MYRVTIVLDGKPAVRFDETIHKYAEDRLRDYLLDLDPKAVTEVRWETVSDTP